jgi:hypothetical protein
VESGGESSHRNRADLNLDCRLNSADEYSRALVKHLPTSPVSKGGVAACKFKPQILIQTDARRIREKIVAAASKLKPDSLAFRLTNVSARVGAVDSRYREVIAVD